jgi:hypothetical protein
MKLFTKIVLGISILIVGGIIAVPNIYNSKIDEYIVKSEKDFKDKGIDIEIKNTKDTYFNVKREYAVTITDSSFILKDIFKNFGTQLTTYQIRKFKKNFDDTKFLFLINLPKYPSYQKDAITISLKDFSTNIEKKLSKEKIGRDLLSFIDNKGIEVKISLDNFKIREARLKDIDLTLRNQDTTIKEYTKNIIVTFNDINKIKINIEKIDSNLQAKNSNYEFIVNSFFYNLNEKNDLNSIEDIKIKNISLIQNNFMNNNQFRFNDIKSNSILATKNDIFNLINNLEIKNINMSTPNLGIELNNIITKISFNNLKEKTIQSVINSLDKGEKEKLYRNLEKLFNEGFLFNLDKVTIDSTKFSSPKNDFDFGKFSLHSTLNIKSNTLSLINTKTPQLLNYINSNLNIELLEKDVIQIMTKLKLPTDFLQYVRIEKDNAFIDAELKTNHIYVNKKMVL